MSVLYRFVKNNNEKSKSYGQYFIKAVMTQTTDLSMLADRIQRNCTAKRSDVLAVLTELVEVMQDELQASHRVKLDGFGSFKIGISSTCAESPKKFSLTDNMKGLHVNFTPETKTGSDKKRTKTFLTGCHVQFAPKNADIAGDPESGDNGNSENP
ncbi:MAG: HU family DNA-binding protein [Prevotella sp.]|nr:HU family DNA-binding protein [Prevotella sp.]